MNESARAFAPGNISGVFKVIPDDDPSKMHSLGLGFTVREGATVTLAPATTASLIFNGKAIDFPTVNNVLAGPVKTDFLTATLETRAKEAGRSAEELIKETTEGIPMRRLGKPEEVGDLVAFLASDRAGYMTGANVVIDGGRLQTLS